MAAREVSSAVSRRTAVALLLLTVLLWSTSGLFVKLSSLNPIALAGARSLITAVVLWIWIRQPRFTFSRVQILGALCMTATFLLFISATRLTSAANAIFLQYTAPVWVALFAGWYLGERAHSWDWWILGVIVAGMALFFGDKLSTQGMVGNVLAIISGVTLAWMTLLLRKEPGRAGEMILLGNILTAIVGVPFLFVQMSREAIPAIEWLYLVLLGVFQLGVPFILYSIAVTRLAAVETIVISTMEPIINPIWVFLGTGEAPGALATLGGAVVISAVTVRSLIAGGILRLRGAQQELEPAGKVLPPVQAASELPQP